jgi:tetratricopeptide (TPR) repeat protein
MRKYLLHVLIISVVFLLAPTAHVATYAGELEDAIESFKKAIKIDPDHAKSHFHLGNAYNESGMYEEAIESYKEAIGADPDNVLQFSSRAHVSLGAAYIGLGKYQEAVESLKQAIRIDPDHVKAHYNLGLAYKKSGMNKKAIESYKQAVRIDPDYRDAHYNLGVAYISLSDRGSAMGQMMILRRLDYVLSYELYNLVEEKFKEEHPP